jgi:hypothetical protein
MKTSYHGTEYRFNCFEDLWAFYRGILVQSSTDECRVISS